ncbi:MAG TPA: RasGAP domain-containing protein [Gammaproteobacteria bacterium]|nr:RasGAP domain-containing protein [Gammaproteobacteria bacterium]
MDNDNSSTPPARHPSETGVSKKRFSSTPRSPISSDVFSAPPKDIFMPTIDIFIAHPVLLETVLTTTYPGLPDHEDVFARLLRARRCLPDALTKLLELEFIKNAKNPHVLLREDDAARRLISAMLKTEQSMHIFCTQFKATLEPEKKVPGTPQKRLSFLKNSEPTTPELSEGNKLILQLRNCISYFSRLPDENFPPELIMVLRLIKAKVIEHKIDPADCSKILGAIFFLRLICPALVGQNILLSKALQFVSNQSTPEDNHNNQIFLSVRAKMEELHQPTAGLLNRMADIPAKEETFMTSLEQTAETFYRHVICEIKTTDEAALLALAQLKERLDHAPETEEAPTAECAEQGTKAIARVSKRLSGFTK